MHSQKLRYIYLQRYAINFVHGSHFFIHSRSVLMETQKHETAPNQSGATSKPAATSCRKKKNEEATFLEDVKDHIDEFINASMDEHATCFKKTIHKMFGMSKIIAKQNAEAKEVESILPLQTTVTKWTGRAFLLCNTYYFPVMIFNCIQSRIIQSNTFSVVSFSISLIVQCCPFVLWHRYGASRASTPTSWSYLRYIILLVIVNFPIMHMNFQLLLLLFASLSTKADAECRFYEARPRF
ncbi:hypothetical protein Droror1_Dr00005629 [Drosera rotundifolia]